MKFREKSFFHCKDVFDCVKIVTKITATRSRNVVHVEWWWCDESMHERNDERIDEMDESSPNWVMDQFLRILNWEYIYRLWMQFVKSQIRYKRVDIKEEFKPCPL